MARVRRRLIEIGAIPANTPPLSPLLDFAAVSAVADCVSLGESINNRAIVRAGLARINGGSRPCWRALARLLGDRGPITEETIAFQIAPRLSASGRLDAAMPGVRFLLSRSDIDAWELLELLSKDNETRKTIQSRMVDVCMTQAEKQISEGHRLMVLFDESFHQGVCGIACSRVCEAFGRPGFVFAPAWGDPALLSGSGRAYIKDMDMTRLLHHIREQAPELVLSGGGHPAACGVKIRREDLERFRQLTQLATLEILSHVNTVPPIETDGELSADQITLSLIHELASFAPYGKGFSAPLFELDVVVKCSRPVGDGTHLKLTLEAGRRKFSAIWFGAMARHGDIPLATGDRARIAFRPTLNQYRGNTSVQLEVLAAHF